MFTVQANHEDIRYFYTMREAQAFAKSYAKEHGIVAYIKTGNEPAPKAETNNTDHILKALGELRDKQKTKAGTKAIDDAINIIMPF